MPTLQDRLTDFATRVATETKSNKLLINGNVADLSALTTTVKTNLVAAINEVNAAVASSSGIDDGVTGTGTTWSSSKIDSEIDAAVAALVASAPGALDTLDELAAALGDDANFATTTATALGNRLRVDTAAQGLTGTEQSNARTNLGLGSLATQSGTFSGTSSGTNTGDQTITLTGDVTGTGTGSFAATLAASGVTAGTYKSVTVDAKGRVTAGTNPTTLAGYGITDAAPISHVGAGGTAHANVVAAGAAGFMTGADKSKLDGIASGATANIGTVTSVSGTGTVSGLTLTGTVTTTGNLTLGGTLAVTGSQISDATTTGLAALIGTVPPPTITDVGVLDESIPPGFSQYNTSSGSSGGPSGLLRGVLWHTRRNSGGGETQLIIVEEGTGLASGAVFCRSRITGAWSAWAELMSSLDIGEPDTNFVTVFEAGL